MHTTSGRRDPLSRVAMALGIAVLPVVVAIVLARSIFDATPGDALPLINDEVAYWNQIATFAAAGFGGGYITVDERPSRLTWSRFGPHGPAFPVIFGLAAKLFGWGYTSGPVFGALAFIIAASAWMLFTRPSPLIAAPFVATFSPLVLALPTTMQEPLHFAIGCVLAGLVLRVMTDEQLRPRLLAACLVILVIASLVRPVWALLAIPLGWYIGRRRSPLHAGLGLAAGTACMAVLYVAFMANAAPFPSGGSPQLSQVIDDPGDAIHRVIRRATVESPEDWLSPQAQPLERLVRAELVGLALITGLLSLRRGDAAAVRRVDRLVSATTVLLIAAVLALGNIGGWQDFRATTPLMFMLLLLCVATRPRLAAAVAAIQILTAPLAITAFERVHDQRFSEARRTAVDAFANQARRHITFDPALPPWGNTVLINADNYQAPLLALPRGIGASAVVYWRDVTLPIRSRYVLLTEGELNELGTRVHLRKLADTSIGQLFENLDWQR